MIIAVSHSRTMAQLSRQSTIKAAHAASSFSMRQYSLHNKAEVQQSKMMLVSHSNWHVQ